MVLLSLFLAYGVAPAGSAALRYGMMDAINTGTARARAVREKLTLITARGPVTLMVEVARSEQEKALGLMFRTALADDTGMLFAYGREQIITMWMKNTYIPLDMVFIRADGTVGHIAVKTTPLSEEIVSSVGPARYVLEIAGGAAERLGLKVGDRVRHELIGAD